MFFFFIFLFRFLFPIYPLLTLCAVLCIENIKRIWNCIFNGERDIFQKILLNGTIVIFLLLSLSRIFALYIHYQAPMKISMVLGEAVSEKNVCIAKEWHRIPGNFFMPKNHHLRFVRSSFNGILPAYFDETKKGTALVHNYFNDMNLPSDYMLFNLTECDFLIDSDFGEKYRIHDIEQNYSKDKSTWEIIKSMPFLDSKVSSSFFRAFYVPLISTKYTKFGNFNLLKRKKWRRLNWIKLKKTCVVIYPIYCRLWVIMINRVTVRPQTISRVWVHPQMMMTLIWKIAIIQRRSFFLVFVLLADFCEWVYLISIQLNFTSYFFLYTLIFDFKFGRILPKTEQLFFLGRKMPNFVKVTVIFCRNSAEAIRCSDFVRILPKFGKNNLSVYYSLFYSFPCKNVSNNSKISIGFFIDLELLVSRRKNRDHP